ncbi:FtsH protease activity modulator HflK [Frigidibacter sp. RF13]|uniref:FtsH protease activity modulator HflK n=1 Tax=Frigidibacter sp. RF13 TaxID=2997340 RepID=UPI00227003F3|nr:FtsH protease activity modulator HflK [Frigidibacter sp. RF13]MCY1126933.1 FtsH protease activity modulator HflK [Frigidibacter sp. RF13]
MAGSGGPWGGGGSGNDDDDDRRRGDREPPRGGRRGEGSPISEIDDLVRKGTEQFKVLMGGRGGRNGQGGGFGGGSGGPGLPRNALALGALAAVGLWAFASFYTVKPEEKSVELFLGKRSAVGEPGLNFAPWPLYSYEVIPVTPERTEDIGVGNTGGDEGLMLTGDENIVDIDFQVVWNVNDPEKYLFNLRDPQLTIRAVSESSMREIIAQSPLAPILNRDRGAIAQRLQELIQQTLDSYDSGLNVVRVNFDRADPPREVIDAFKEVQSAEQERDRLQKEADAYSNRVVAGARGEAAATLEAAEAYRAQVVNQAEGEASRFSAVLAEYQKAPEVTRKRLYLETMEEVMGRVNKVILDENAGGQQGVVPFLPLNEIGKPPAGAKPAAGGNN